MDVEIAFKVPSECVDGQIDAGQEVMLRGQLFDDVGGERRNRVKEVAIDPEKGLEVGRQGPGDMLPCRVWKGVESGFNPIVGGFFAAGGTETRFTGMRRFDPAEAFWTDKDMPAEERGAAGEHFKHIDNNGDADQLAVGKK